MSGSIAEREAGPQRFSLFIGGRLVGETRPWLFRPVSIVEAHITAGEMTPGIYLLLLQRNNPQKNWWELPGGAVSNRFFTSERWGFDDEGERERIEETCMDLPERTERGRIDLHAENQDRFILRGSDRDILSPTSLVRFPTRVLPDVYLKSVGNSEPEHSDYLWLSVGNAYSYQQPSFHFLEENESQEVPVLYDPRSPHVGFLAGRLPRSQSAIEVRTIQLSTITTNVLLGYSEQYISQPRFQWPPKALP